MSLLTRFRAFLETNVQCRADERLLLAVSGGIDSVLMAHLFRESGWSFGIAHCNFQLRGAESDQDEVFVRDLANTWDIPFFVQHFDTEAFATENGLSVQMAARALRYRWFEETGTIHGFDYIATAHSLDDSAETALLNFTRGTGISGLGGIAVKNGPVIRPLLFATREDIEAYAASEGISWREDSSNASDKYARNAIRHHVIPVLKGLNPDFLHTAENTLRRLRDTAANLQFLTEQYFGKNPQQIDKEVLMQTPAPRQLLFELLQPFGFTDEQSRQVAENLSQTGMEWQSPLGYRLLIDRKFLLLQTAAETNSASITIQDDDLMISLPDSSRLVFIPAIPAPPYPDGRDAVLVDSAKLRYPLQLRPWQAGDVFQPFGMDGRHQKLQDFFTNQKLSRFEKEQVWVLENGDGAIIWVLGYRLDERFKIEQNTQNALKINRVDLT